MAQRRIKIAHVITRMDWGGAPDIVRIICSYLDKNEYDVTLIFGATNSLSSRTRDFLAKSQVKVIVIPQLRRDIHPLNDLSAFWKICRALRRGKFDIVHTHTAKAGALGRMAARCARAPVVFHTPHGHNFYGYFGSGLSKVVVIIERMLAAISDKILVLTELEKQDMIGLKVTVPHKVIVLYQGLELDCYLRPDFAKVSALRKEYAIRPDDIVVGMIGRLEQVKGAQYFVAAAHDITGRHPRAKFLVAGEGSLRARLSEMAEAMGMKEKFIFTGWSENIPELLGIFDLLVLPSLNEAVGMALIEAQAAGVPVVATNVGGIPEVVIHNMTGLLVPPANAAELAKAIDTLLTDTQQRFAMASAARAWIKDRFRAEDMVRTLSLFYRQAMTRFPRTK